MDSQLDASSGLRSISRADLGALAAEQLRDLILSGDLPPGERLVEADLARRMGISRTPVRDALARLRHDGLVENCGRRGSAVAALTATEVWEIYPLLATLERFALTHSRPHSDEDLAGVEEINARLRAAGTENQRIELDAEWHDRVLGRCENQSALEFLRPLKQRARRYEVVYMTSSARLEESWEEHDHIVTALRSGAVESAAEKLERHWMRSVAPLLEAVFSRDAPVPPTMATANRTR
jgi:DNA-binding GntR family transcriptional regulator